jgi:hypothetical protein
MFNIPNLILYLLKFKQIKLHGKKNICSSVARRDCEISITTEIIRRWDQIQISFDIYIFLRIHFIILELFLSITKEDTPRWFPKLRQLREKLNIFRNLVIRIKEATKCVYRYIEGNLYIGILSDTYNGHRKSVIQV